MSALPAIPVLGTSPCITNECSLCCHDIEMVLTEEDLARLQAARPGEDFWFEAEDHYLQLHTRDGPPGRGGHGRPCWFLAADGRCSVHDVRPEGCRLYPAFMADEVDEVELDADYCPHTEGFRLTGATQDAVRRLTGRLRQQRLARLAERENAGSRLGSP